MTHPEPISRAELTQWAQELERAAGLADSGAREWEGIAGDASRTEYERACAERAAGTLRSDAGDFRAEAVIMRDGSVPQRYEHLYETAVDD